MKNISKKIMKKLIIICIMCILIWIVKSIVCKEEKTILINYCKENAQAETKVYSTDKLVSGLRNYETMRNNTIILQRLINTASQNGGGTVKIAAGEYYFAPLRQVPRHDTLEIKWFRSREWSYIIRCKSNVTIEGAGVDGKNKTTLYPYGNTDMGIDMFYFFDIFDDEDTYEGSYPNNGVRNKELNNPMDENNMLINAQFKNFVVDGSKVNLKGSYSSAGKAFDMKLYKDCIWDNVIVQNTIATGFGMDSPVGNCKIINCKAINCGRGVRSSSDEGGAGFGIGTGLREDESILIENCYAENCGKFGFFIENQTRFDDGGTFKAKKSAGCCIINCTAKDNMYDFGGLRANDVIYKNCKSKSTANSYKNQAAFHFGNYCRRISVIDCTQNRQFSDVKKEDYYYEPIYWGSNEGIVRGTSYTKFSPNNNLKKSEGIIFLYRMAGRPGKVVCGRTIDKNYFNTGYADSNEEYTRWAIDSGIIAKGNGKDVLNNKELTRAEFIYMLWKYAGSVNIAESSNIKISDLNGVSNDMKKAIRWAVVNNITRGTKEVNGVIEFTPNGKLTRAQAITFLYRYSENMEKLSINEQNIVMNNNETKQVGYTHISNIGDSLLTKVFDNKILKAEVKNNKINIRANGVTDRNEVVILEAKKGDLYYNADAVLISINKANNSLVLRLLKSVR